MNKDFIKLLTEAVKVCEAYDAAEKQRKLTAKAFLREALEVANTNNQRLDALEMAIERPIMERSRQFYRNALKFIKEPFCSCPPRLPRKLNWLVQGHTDELTAELATARSNTFELFALAVRTCTRKFPKAFGTITDMVAHNEKLKALELERNELYRQIETSYAPSDLQIRNVSGGTANVSFAISGGEVPLGEHGGERLTGWLREHPEALK